MWFPKEKLSVFNRGLVALTCACWIAVPGGGEALADGGVSFQDIAKDGGAGITFERVPSASNEIFDALKRNSPPYGPDQRLETPMKARGAPGVAIFDYDGDGDLDVYATNGPGAGNALYSNQLREQGQTVFVDRAAEAGVAAVEADSTGVCFGDTDNDGDHDLYVLTNGAPNLFFENLGNGTFRDVSAASGTAGPPLNPSGCTLGDVDGDGLLDIAVGNTFTDWTHFRGIFEPFAFNQHNQLFLNQGGNVFTDVSAASGIRDLAGLPPDQAGSAGLTWAVALVDYDLDGDVDLLTADDQGGVPPGSSGGLDRGFLHVFQNDGTGHFTDVSLAAGTKVPGGWMGYSFGDFNCDGLLDFFATNFGDYNPVGTPSPGREPSRWWYQQPGGSFLDPGVGEFATTPFGWGTSTFDYDNDGDTDIIYHGGHDVGPGVELSNPGIIFQNRGCSGSDFSWDRAALAGSTDHLRRVVHGMAVGDLDENGFPDIVSVSNLDIQPEIPLTPHRPVGSPFDEVATFVVTFEPNAAGELMWNGNVYPNGTLAIELNSGGNGNGWVSVEAVGSRGLTPGGRVNRDGIGAVVMVTPRPGLDTAIRPVVGGASYASQDSLPATFGLGVAGRAHVEVLWPGGVRNRLYNVRAGERIVFPEIPCPFDGSLTFRQYLACVSDALDDLVDEGVLTRGQRARFLMSALRAYPKDSSPNCTVKEGGSLPAGLQADPAAARALADEEFLESLSADPF